MSHTVLICPPPPAYYCLRRVLTLFLVLKVNAGQEKQQRLITRKMDQVKNVWPKISCLAHTTPTTVLEKLLRTVYFASKQVRRIKIFVSLPKIVPLQNFVNVGSVNFANSCLLGIDSISTIPLFQ